MSHSLPDSDLEPTPLREGDGAPVSAPAVIPGLREVGGERQRLAASRGDAPMRVLMSSYRSNPNTGGQGVYMRLITKALVDEGHQVDVISGPPYPDLDPRVGLIELPSLDLYARPDPIASFRLRWLKEPTNLFEWVAHNSGGFAEPYTFGRRMTSYLKGRTHEYDLCHDNQTLCWGLLDVEAMGLPVVGLIHHPITVDRRVDIQHARSLSLKLLKWRWYRFLGMQMAVARKLERVIVVSESTRRDVMAEFGLKPEQLSLVLHGINHKLFCPMPEVPRKPNQLVCCASADVPLKGLIYLIRAYAELLKRFPDLELKVIGRLREGNTSDELRALGILDRVTFVSGLTDEELVALYAESTIAISPSVYEGFGFPAGEAMACGMPVIATTGGSLPEVVGDAGIVVPHSNPNALAEAIAGLLNDPDRRDALGQAARQRILDHFTWARAARETAEVYRARLAHADHRSHASGT